MTTSDVDVDLQTPIAQQGASAIKGYTFNLDGVLPPGDTLAAVVWSTSDAALLVDSSSVSQRSCSVRVKGGVASTWYAVVGNWVSSSGEQDEIVLRVFIKQDAQSVSQLGSALFPNRITAIKRLRSDQLMVASAGVLTPVEVSDDYLWDKLRAAEAEAQRDLRVFFQATALFPDTPSDADVAALNGMPWAIDPGYDFGPANFYEDKWGMVVTRQKPIISVTSIKMVYPSPGAVSYTFPSDWLRLDRKYGHIRIVPTSVLSMASLSASIMQLFSSRTLPQALEVQYIAGLQNPTVDYPDLVDLVLKKAVVKILGDRFLPQSGSISGDGLSQSMSIDMEKYRDMIDVIINGPKGSNGGLMSAIHGIRMSSLGC